MTDESIKFFNVIMTIIFNDNNLINLEASEVMTNFFSVTLFLKNVSFNSQKEEKNDCNNLSV